MARRGPRASRSVAALALLVLAACGGDERPTGTSPGQRLADDDFGRRDQGERLAAAALARVAGRARALPYAPILFGDLRLRAASTDACDFARHCAALDFFALTDPAERATHGWWAIREGARGCDALGGGPGDPAPEIPVVADGAPPSRSAHPGGLVAVHAVGRSGEAIREALRRREVYATSGPRILLWFDLLNGPRGAAPMGSEVAMAGAPRFEVRAAGALLEEPGCPESARAALGPARLAELCAGACANPGDGRHAIAAIEVVRIRPQRSGEPGAALVEDPWRRIECAPTPAGCAATFEDPDFAAGGRDALYSARALEAPAPEGGRAWSSPILVRFAREGE